LNPEKKMHRVAAWACALPLAMAGANVGAAVTAVDVGDFPAGSLLVDYNSTPVGTNASGLTVDGLTFGCCTGRERDPKPAYIAEWSGATYVDGHVIYVPEIDGGTPVGTMGMLMPGPSTMFGLGYYLPAIGTGVPGGFEPNALTIKLFDDSVVPNTLVGTLSFNAYSDGDPLDPWSRFGGYAGIASTLPFNRVNVTFNSNVSTVAVDNFRVTAVPEPSTGLLMLALGVPAVSWLKRRRAGTAPGRQHSAFQALV
jgi:hypothetical protein